MPHRHPGAPAAKGALSGKAIGFYRPKGSSEVRHLIDEGFQAFNAARLSEACQVFAEKMLAPENDTTIGLTIAGAMTPAGLGGCVIEMMDRGLVDFVISTGANLYHDLHYALNFTLSRGSPFVDDVICTSTASSRIYDVLFFRRRCARDQTRTFAIFSSGLGWRPYHDGGASLSPRPDLLSAFRDARNTRLSLARRRSGFPSIRRRPATARSG